MNRANMAKQITEVPMAGCKSKGYAPGGRVTTSKKSGADQSQCSPRKYAAMNGMAKVKKGKKA